MTERKRRSPMGSAPLHPSYGLGHGRRPAPSLSNHAFEGSRCKRRLRPIAALHDPEEIARHLAHTSETTTYARGPPRLTTQLLSILQAGLPRAPSASPPGAVRLDAGYQRSTRRFRTEHLPSRPVNDADRDRQRPRSRRHRGTGSHLRAAWASYTSWRGLLAAAQRGDGADEFVEARRHGAKPRDVDLPCEEELAGGRPVPLDERLQSFLGAADDFRRPG